MKFNQKKFGQSFNKNFKQISNQFKKKFKNKKFNKNQFNNNFNSNGLSADTNKTFVKNYNNFHKNNINQNVNRCSAVINRQRNELPISSVKNKIIEVIKSWETVIFLGETGSGKTTQIPQYLYESGILLSSETNGQNNGIIGVTQPRRVAAITIAGRVATEMGCQLGSIVGYSVRFEDMTSFKTKIKYLTDGILLREAITDPLLAKYKVIILDEVHERTVTTDILLGVVKKAQQLRTDQKMPVLKVILMSATMDCDHFSKYLKGAPIYYILGRQHSIQMMYTTRKQSDYIQSALITVFQIHKNSEKGDILVFCTGQEEIDLMIRSVQEVILELPKAEQNLKALPLYAALPTALQQKVFKELEEKDFRKVIFATNIAETSITIPNIKYVLDTGKVKCRSFSPKTGLEALKVQSISKAQASQRAGRAGRIMSGVCYRLFTKEEYDSFKDHTVPEIQRINLTNVLLHLIAIGINDVFTFDFIDKPSEETIRSAMEQLLKLGAVHTKDDSYFLTEMGKLMVLFPVEPKYSKIIITSKSLHCTEEILTIISLLSVDNIYYIPSTQKEIANEVHKKFNSSEGDLIKMLKVFKSFKASKENNKWCKENYIHINNVKLAADIRKQLSEICLKANIPLVSSNNNTEIIRKCLTTGLVFNVAHLQRDGTYKTISKQEVQIHPSSCLFGSKPEHIIFNELIQTSKSYMRNITVVDEQWIS